MIASIEAPFVVNNLLKHLVRGAEPAALASIGLILIRMCRRRLMDDRQRSRFDPAVVASEARQSSLINRAPRLVTWIAAAAVAAVTLTKASLKE